MPPSHRPASYYAVIFSSKLSDRAAEKYEPVANLMVELAKVQPGFLGFESVRDEQGQGITVSYWDSLEAIQKWKEDREHLRAQMLGKKDFYENYHIRVAQVINEYGSK